MRAIVWEGVKSGLTTGKKGSEPKGQGKPEEAVWNRWAGTSSPSAWEHPGQGCPSSCFSSVEISSTANRRNLDLDMSIGDYKTCFKSQSILDPLKGEAALHLRDSFLTRLDLPY